MFTPLALPILHPKTLDSTSPLRFSIFTRPPRSNSTAAAGTLMASSIGGSGSSGRGSRARMPAGGIEDAQKRMLERAEQRAAVETARASAGASQSGGWHTSQNLAKLSLPLMEHSRRKQENSVFKRQ